MSGRRGLWRFGSARVAVLDRANPLLPMQKQCRACRDRCFRWL